MTKTIVVDQGLADTIVGVAKRRHLSLSEALKIVANLRGVTSDELEEQIKTQSRSIWMSIERSTRG